MNMRRHKTALDWRLAVPHTRYWRSCRERCRRECLEVPHVAEVDTFRRDGITSFQSSLTQRVAQTIDERLRRDSEAWGAEILGSGNLNFRSNPWQQFPEIKELCERELEPFLTAFFGCHFKIFQTVLYKSTNQGKQTGSQLWHTDTGPGTYVNLMFYLHPITSEMGPLQALSWETTMRVYWLARRNYRRAVRMGTLAYNQEARRNFIAHQIDEQVANSPSDIAYRPISARAGLVVPFMNNLLHAGGYPALGLERRAIVFQFYPASQKVDYHRYASQPSGDGFPRDPGEDF